MVRNGRPAPDFTLKDADGKERLLTELRRGKPLLLYFFRFADCPTARRDLASYAEAYPRITAFGAEMVAINTEFHDVHLKLRDELRLPYPILSDAGFRISDRYGVYRSDDKEGPSVHGEPAVFIVDVDGKMAYSQIQTGPKGTTSPDAMALILYYMSQNDGKY